MLTKFDVMYMDVANRIGQLSYSKRSQVGALLVRDDNILSFGYNGTPRGFENCCEDDSNVTKPEVLHAESNAIAKVARTTSNSEGSTLYTTLSPCFDCAKMIHQAGVVRVIYQHDYRDMRGIEFLEKCGVTIEKVQELG
jgi:dCMP deaminase